MGKGVGWGSLALAVAVTVSGAGCASVKLVQRDGCWIRRTESLGKQVKEEIGPCARPAPKWSEDRLARLVQECVAQEDHRWHNRALAAWSRGAPVPEPAPKGTVLKSCIAQAGETLLGENETLKARLAELAEDRERLAGLVEEDRTHLRESHLALTEALGEAAVRPAPSAVATATSSGTARTDSETRTQAPQPAAVITALPLATGPTCAAPPPKRRVAAKPSKAKAPDCEPAAKDAPDGEVALNGGKGKDAETKPAK